MDDIPLADMVKKKKSGSATQKGKTNRRKSENDDKEDNSLKVKVRKKVDTGGGATDSSIAEVHKPKVSDEDVNAVAGAEPKDFNGDKSAAEKSTFGRMVNVVGEEDAGDSEIKRVGEDTLKSAMKLKRGADGEIVQAYFSSAEKNLSRCRPRKEVPIFRMVDLSKDDRHKIVGKRVKVYWSGSRKWFVGRIQAFDRKKEQHSILYDDGDKEMLDLTKERFELEILPSEGFNLIFESRFRKKVGSFNGLEGSEDTLEEISVKISDTENSRGGQITEKKSTSKKVADAGESGPGESASKEESGDLKGVAEITHEANKKLEAQAAQDGRLETNTEGRTTLFDGSDSEEKKTEQILKDESNKDGGIRPAKKGGSSRRKAISSTRKRRKVNLVNKDMSQETEKMEADAHTVEAKPSSVQSSIQDGEDVKDNHQTGSNEILKENKNEDSMVLLPHATAPCQNMTSSEGSKFINGASDEIGKHAKMEITSADTVNVSSNVEVAVLTLRMVKDKVPTEEINKETTIDIITGKDDEGKLSSPKESSEGFIEEPRDLQSTSEVIPKESSLGNMQGKLDAENGQPDQIAEGQEQEKGPSHENAA